MTKLSEKITVDADGKVVVQQSHDFHAVAERAKALQSAGMDGLGKDNKLLGTIPMKLIHEAAKARGVKFDDQAAMKEVVLDLLEARSMSDFRVWTGTFR